ncbi:hypothetical protein C2S51_015900 [Perilla frutescens var. frutescens]|nr:hypothetical protein C2S51_015900 [Perilla frutescens var. frutescens]
MVTTTVIEICRVAPPPGAVAEQSVPLTFFDMMWLHFHPVAQLLFYEFPCSNPHFSETIVPKLKQSLSKTLKHFFPLSCNLIYPLSPDKMPEFRYLSGDSVSFTIAESSYDFEDLVGNRADSADRLYSFVPKLPPVIEESDRKIFQVFAVQVTLFPGHGVGIGIVTHHAVNDAASFQAFIKSWASMSKHGGEDENEALVVVDRSVVKYPTKLDSIYWEKALKVPSETRYPSLPRNRIRTTYVFSASDIKKLKALIQGRIPDSIHLSSFVAIAAYIWTGITRSLRADEDDDEEPAFFLIPIDLRPRLDPPVPGNYFGNCLAFALPRMRRRELIGDEGVFLAAEAIAADIKKRTSDERIVESAEKWSSEVGEAVQKSFFSVAGSSRLDLYGADFGWGKARKQEILMIDEQEYAMTLCKARD